MGYYKNLFNQIQEVEREGFDPYSESYTARISQLDGQATEGGREGAQIPQRGAPVADNEASLVTEEQYLEAWRGYGQSQASVTKAFQDKYPQVDVASLLRESTSRKDFSNKDLDKYAKEMTDEHGELLLTADEVKKASPDYYKNLNTIKQKEQSDQTRGDKETEGEEELFGWRHLFERRYSQGEQPYKYLDQFTKEEFTEEVEENTKKGKK